MSKIEKEVSAATGLEAKKGEARAEYLARLMKGIAGLDDKGWDGLSEEAQNWYNDNAEARNKAKKAGKDVPEPTDFPDAKAAEAEEPKSRRRSSDDEDEPKGSKKAAPSLDALEEGQRFKITTKRGKTIEGTVVENNAKKEFLAYKDGDGEEDEIDYSKVESLEAFHGDAGKDDGAGDAEPSVGDEVKLTTKRGKVFKGRITELSDDEVVIATDDGPEDFARDRVETIEVTSKAKAGAKAEKKAAKEEEEPRRAAKEEKKGKEEKEDDAGRTRSKNPDGVSIGTVIKELIAENQDASEKEIGKMLEKKGLEFKENTLKLNFVDCHKFLTILKEKKLLKAAK